MPKYLFEARYSPEGAIGLAKEGGTSRRDAVKKHLKEIGGKLESMYFAFGDVDCFVIVDLPDNVSAAALSLAVNESGMIASKAAYAGGEDWLNQCVDYVDGNHDFTQKFFNANIPMIKVGAKPQGTYLTWLDVSAVANKINAKQLAAEVSKTQAASMKPLTPEQMVERHLVKAAKVHMNAGSSYGYGGANHMRMNIATSRKTLELALNNLATALRTT